jgi:methylated-DNA-[protein]-cysteine S-methyltransferase
MSIESTTMASPIGPLTLFTRAGVLVGIDFGEGAHTLARLRRRFGAVEVTPCGAAVGAADRLSAYLGGDLDALDALEVDPGGTDFQARVWRGLRAIPAGHTLSYGELARAIGSPKAVRAVGGANHENPIPIVIPCHRVIGADGHLTGYGGGLDTKRWLLRHEGLDLPQ